MASKRRRLVEDAAEGAGGEEASAEASAVEARLGQIIFVKQVVSIGAVISRSSHFIYVFLTLKVQAVAVPFVALTVAEARMLQEPPAVFEGGARNFQLWMRYLRCWAEPPPLVVPPLTGAYRRLLWNP